jgi:hypothetical protein
MICPRCKREAVGWPLRRADRCSPKDWVRCLREPDNVRATASHPNLPRAETSPKMPRAASRERTLYFRREQKTP